MFRPIFSRLPHSLLTLMAILALGLSSAKLPMAQATIASDLVIYDDGLAGGWDDWSWDSTLNFNATSPVQSGTNSIAVTYNAAFGGLSFRTAPPVNPSGYTALAFWVYGGSGGTALSLSTQITDTSAAGPAYNFTAPAGVWTHYTVPLSALGNPSAIARLNLQENAGATPTIYVDEVRLVSAASTSSSVAGIPDAIADRVLGQRSFNANSSGGTASTLQQPAGVAIASDGRVFVADYKNNRVLSWATAINLSSGQAADLVLGKPDFTTVGVDPDSGEGKCQLPISASNTTGPESVALDANGNLYVADTYCHRVLIFGPPFTNGMNASMVLGQPNMTTGTGCVGPSNGLKYCYSRGVTVDASGTVFATDELNHRVLGYASPLTTDAMPDYVIGQADFTGGSANRGGPPAANTLNGPRAAQFDAAGNLYVADLENNRVLEYDAPLTTNVVADRVFGQGGSFTTNLANNGGLSANSLSWPVDLLTDAYGNLYISDVLNNRVLEFDHPLTTDTTADRVFGQRGSFTSGSANLNGINTTGLDQPLGMALDAQGNLYLADLGNNRVVIYTAPPANLLNVNLIANPNAEANLGSTDGSFHAPGSWMILQGELSAVNYGATGGYPTNASPGPPNRGLNFFYGGNNVATTQAEQMIDVSALGAAIDNGAVRFNASGYFGGYLTDNDIAYLDLNFQDASHVLVSQITIGGITDVDRQNITGLLPDGKIDIVPTTTRYIQLNLRIQRTDGSDNDGYADNLSLVLTAYQLYLPLIQR